MMLFNTRINGGTNAPDGSAKLAGVSILRSHLFRKYVILFVLAVGLALLANTLIDTYSWYQDQTSWLSRVQRGQADEAATKIGQFVNEIRAEIGWTTQFNWSDETPVQLRSDALRVLHMVPAIAELSRLDPTGHEQLRVSRVDATAVGSNIDFSRDPKFVDAIANGVYYGPVYFREATEPFMTLAIGRQGAGVTIAEISLKYIWDVVSGIKVGKHGAAYVVDARGKLIAHPNLGLVLRNMDVSGLAQVRAARAPDTSEESARLAKDVSGREVLTANAAIAPLGWFVFVELPIDEAYAPLYASLGIRGALLLGGLGLAVVLSLVVAGRMVKPIQALQASAARIGAGRLEHRIQIATGDELQAMGDEFNRMASQLQDSYATLEAKVAERTNQLELANLAKTRFIAAASHDLRQPLHALSLLIGQLDTANRAGRRQVMARIDAAFSNVNELFNALLDISKLDAGAVNPDIKSFPMEPMLRNIETMFTAVVCEKSLRLRVLASNVWVRSDRVLLERILLNLISNAIRYTEHGGVVVGCRRRGGAVRIEVWDSGIGIPQDQREYIFGEFYRVGGVGADRGGLGLGLAIVDRLCRLLKHPLELSSIYGKGSRFSLTVPQAPAQSESAETLDPLQVFARRPFAGRSVVIIDDDKLVLSGMGGLLQDWGCHVSAFRSGAAAEAALLEQRRVPDLIICDYHLIKGEIGGKVIPGLRRALNAEIPALLITGDISLERKQEAEAGRYGLLQKPVLPMILRAMLQRVWKQSVAIEVPVDSDRVA